MSGASRNSVMPKRRRRGRPPKIRPSNGVQQLQRPPVRRGPGRPRKLGRPRKVGRPRKTPQIMAEPNEHLPENVRRKNSELYHKQDLVNEALPNLDETVNRLKAYKIDTMTSRHYVADGHQTNTLYSLSTMLPDDKICEKEWLSGAKRVCSMLRAYREIYRMLSAKRLELALRNRRQTPKKIQKSLVSVSHGNGYTYKVKIHMGKNMKNKPLEPKSGKVGEVDDEGDDDGEEEDNEQEDEDNNISSDGNTSNLTNSSLHKSDEDDDGEIVYEDQCPPSIRHYAGISMRAVARHSSPKQKSEF